MKVVLVLFTLCVVWLNEVFCQSTVGPNTVCTSDASCATYVGSYCGYYSQCLKCVCPSTGYIYDATLKKCLAVAKIGEACESNAQCPNKGGSATTGSCSSNVCACDSGYAADTAKTTCRKPLVGEKCTTAVGCFDSTTIDCSSSGVCTCNTNYPQVSDNKESCRKKWLTETCTADADCLPTITGVTCPTATKVCTCPDTTSGPADNKQSCKAQVLDGKCNGIADCNNQNTMSCNANLCKCGTGNIQDGTTCRLPEFGETCTGTTCDTTADPNLDGTCPTTGGTTCVCKAGYFAATARAKCLKVNIDSACVAADNTCGANTQCTGTPALCKCITDYVKDTNNYDCRKPYLDESCTANANVCAGTDVNPVCPAGGKCECAQYRQKDTTSTGNCRKSKLTEACGTAAADCDQSITSVQCTNNKCACPSTMNEANGQCVNAKYGETCSGSVTKNCDTGMICGSTSKTCECATGDVYDSTISTCKNSGAEVAVAEGNVCTVIPANPVWTSSSPVYKQCNTALTGAAKLYCRQCDNAGDLKCNTAIADPSASGTVHANIVMILLAVTVAVFYKM